MSTYAILRLIGQASPDRLVSAEQIQSGGAYSVRGYREGQFLGDSGILASAEWRVPCFLFPIAWKIPKTGYGLRDNIQLVSFIDYGSTYLNKPGTGLNHSEHLLGVGIGIRAKLTRFLAGRVDLGIPLLRAAGVNSSPRIHFALQSDLF